LGFSGSTDGEISAEVIAFPNLSSLKDADDNLVAGKIVFINQPMFRHREGKGYTEVVPNRYAAGMVAKEKGAVAALIRSAGTDSHRFPHAGTSSRVDNPLPAAALSTPDAQQLQRILDRQEKLILALDIKVSEQPNAQSYNVIAQIDGRVDADKIVLISAHLDSWDLGTGAIDDGAGVAITVAAAQLIGELPQRPKHSVRVVLFANEEQGIWGAKAYARQHHDELKNYLFASESDFGAGPVWRFDTANDTLMNKAMPHLATLNIERGSNASRGGPDIKPLLEAGVPVFQLKQDGTDYFDYHHTADDTLDKIDPEALKQNIAAWVVVAFLAADMD
jgi:Zn-dependent M28 family amino/carboxypeptidase